jgi:hypothetical protein
MILVKAPFEEFTELLELLTVELNKAGQSGTLDRIAIQGIGLEKVVFKLLSDLCLGTSFENNVSLISGNKFPDIVVGSYGIEVKTSNTGWTSLGNSIMEGTRIKDIEKIFILFGNLSSTPIFKHRLYEECMDNILITHSPRYSINMDCKEDENIFVKLGTVYDEFRLSKKKVKLFAEYYKTNMSKPDEYIWWLGMDSELEEPIADPTIRIWNTLSKAEQIELVINGAFNNPEVFGKSPKKYNNFSFWLLRNHQVICPNVRDLFSAGGQVLIPYNGNTLLVSQSFHFLLSIKDKLIEVYGLKEFKEFILEVAKHSSEVVQYFDLFEVS